MKNGKEFEQRIYINDVNPSNATVVEMRALEAHYKVEKQGGFTSLPLEAGNMGLNDRRDFIAMFKKSIEDLTNWEGLTYRCFGRKVWIHILICQMQIVSINSA